MLKHCYTLHLLQGDICNTLWCRVGYMCHSKLSAAATGTSCGKDKVNYYEKVMGNKKVTALNSVDG